MNIGIDFDDTISADPKMFVALINNMQNFGHTVRIVTARRTTSKNTDINQFTRRLKRKVEVTYTEGEGKIATMRKLGIHIDIWIDDSPAMVVHGVQRGIEIQTAIYKKYPLE